jgi:hypothetical protein
MRARWVIACLILLAGSVSPSAAQRTSRGSFEFNVGASFGVSSAPHGSSAGVSADVLFGLRLGATPNRGFVVAASGSGTAAGVHTACDALPGGGCAPDFPVFWILSTLVGWDIGSPDARILVGPAVAISSSRQVPAAQLRAELATSISRHWSLLASGRYVYIPDYRGDRFGLGSLGVGFRLR